MYKQMISLRNKENEQVVKLADEALALVSKRKDHIVKEQESMQSSKKKFEDITPLISELKDEELKKQAIELNKTMKKRYEIHNILCKQYLMGIQYDTELYEQLKAKETSLEKLAEQVTKINETYDKVLKTNDEFNAQTEKYNKEKLEFYKKANLNVSE
nr:YkyA family protein [Bacillus sp. T3]